MFLIKWTGHHPSRQSDFADLISCLDVKEISVEVLHKVDLGRLSEGDRLLVCNSLSCSSDSMYDTFVICPPESRPGKFVFYAYKLQSKSWYQIMLLNLSGAFMYWPKGNPVALQNHNTIVRFNSQSKDVWFYDLATKQMTKEI